MHAMGETEEDNRLIKMGVAAAYRRDEEEMW